MVIIMEDIRERLYTMREACSLLRVHPNTIRRWDREGKVRVVRPERGQRRIPESEITRLLTKTPISLPSPKVSPPQEAISEQEHLSSFLSYVFTYHRDDWELVRSIILIRDGYTCSKCGGKELLGVHRKDGTGRNDPENLVTLCHKCHQEIHKSISGPKVHKIESKSPKKPPEKPKTGTTINKALSEGKELSRHTILDELTPAGLAQRTAFGDLLSTAIALRNFSLEEISVRSRCPVSIAKLFCERMGNRGYIQDKEGRYELRVKVIR